MSVIILTVGYVNLYFALYKCSFKKYRILVPKTLKTFNIFCAVYCGNTTNSKTFCLMILLFFPLFWFVFPLKVSTSFLIHVRNPHFLSILVNPDKGWHEERWQVRLPNWWATPRDIKVTIDHPPCEHSSTSSWVHRNAYRSFLIKVFCII